MGKALKVLANGSAHMGGGPGLLTRLIRGQGIAPKEIEAQRLPRPGGFVDQGLIQAQDGPIRLWFDDEGPASGNPGFLLEEGRVFELVSGDQVEDFRWRPDAGAATLVFVLMGRE